MPAKCKLSISEWPLSCDSGQPCFAFPGHFTIAAHRSNTAESAMPPWAQVSPNLDLVCKLHERLSDVCDVQEIDIVVVGIFHQVGRQEPYSHL